MDTSEARYAEMARKMVELNDWITPMFDYGVPFWGNHRCLFGRKPRA
jgi:4-amino-4-deoxy-L-arabinose transferase-like glycosyltransferase